MHLAGTSIAGLWTEKRRREILASRRQGTELIALTAATLARPPRVIVSASAVGWYGDRGDEDLTEESGPGEGFLAEVCRAWEDTLAPAREAGIRVVSTRFGLVLGGAGGLLATMLPAFKLAAGARFGRGDQWMSWVAVDDVLGAILKALQDESLAGRRERHRAGAGDQPRLHGHAGSRAAPSGAARRTARRWSSAVWARWVRTCC